MKKVIVILILTFVSIKYIKSQNIGIGVPIPEEKLDVNGVIFTREGGVRFPDFTLQTTAAYNSAITDGADLRLLPFIEFDSIPGVMDTLNITEAIPLLYSSNPHVREISHTGSGSLVPGDMTIIKNTDGSTPLISSKFFTGAVIPSVYIYYVAVDPGGTVYIYMIIQLQTVAITYHETVTEYAGQGHYIHYEKIGMTFEKIAYTNHLSGECHCFNITTMTPINCGC